MSIRRKTNTAEDVAIPEATHCCRNHRFSTLDISTHVGCHRRFSGSRIDTAGRNGHGEVLYAPSSNLTAMMLRLATFRYQKTSRAYACALAYHVSNPITKPPTTFETSRETTTCAAFVQQSTHKKTHTMSIPTFSEGTQDMSHCFWYCREIDRSMSIPELY